MTSSTSSTSQRFSDPRPILDRAIATGGAVIAGVGPDQFTAPTPCPEMDVRAMLSHLVGVLARIAALGNGEDPFAVIETHAPEVAWSDAWAKSARRPQLRGVTTPCSNGRWHCRGSKGTAQTC